jgi:hypothetical protein
MRLNTGLHLCGTRSISIQTDTHQGKNFRIMPFFEGTIESRDAELRMSSSHPPATF